MKPGQTRCLATFTHANQHDAEGEAMHAALVLLEDVERNGGNLNRVSMTRMQRERAERTKRRGSLLPQCTLSEVTMSATNSTGGGRRVTAAVAAAAAVACRWNG